jgi:hypothetical protein
MSHLSFAFGQGLTGQGQVLRTVLVKLSAAGGPYIYLSIYLSIYIYIYIDIYQVLVLAAAAEPVHWLGLGLRQLRRPLHRREGRARTHAFMHTRTRHAHQGTFTDFNATSADTGTERTSTCTWTSMLRALTQALRAQARAPLRLQPLVRLPEHESRGVAPTEAGRARDTK